MNTSFERSKQTTDEWYTPKWIVDALGSFDLDPCAPENRLWNTAKRHITPSEDSKMFQDLIFPNASAIMFVKGRIKFYRPDGTQGDSPGCGSVLIAFGEENAKILEYSNIPGKYIKLNN